MLAFKLPHLVEVLHGQLKTFCQSLGLLKSLPPKQSLQPGLQDALADAPHSEREAGVARQLLGALDEARGLVVDATVNRVAKGVHLKN